MCFARIKMSNMLHSITKINKPLNKITFENIDAFYTICVFIGNDRYKIRFDSVHDCCEEFGFKSYLGGYYEVEKGKTSLDVMDYTSEIHKTITDIDIFMKKSYRAELVKKTISMEFYSEDIPIFTLEFYNQHNGYYSHSLFVELSENYNENAVHVEEPMKIFVTSI